jgi:hypothetical protein
LIYFPDELKNIGQRAFSGCAGIETIYLLDVETIYNYAFASLTHLNTLSLGTNFDEPTFITLFGDGVFVDENNNSLPYTESVDLILGAEVLPLPNIPNRTWNG